jgi:hypothetical protein
MKDVVRIGNAQAFWGDRNAAAAEMLAREPDLDYLTLDYLAEVSLSILAAQQARDARLGYPRDFVEVIRSLAGYWSSGGRCRLIANAGGLDPRGCAAACAQTLAEAGCRPLRIAVVTGDDVADLLRSRPEHPAFRHLDTQASAATIVDRLVTANAYVGAAPLVDALQQGADIVITGRVADPSLCVAAAVHHHGWALNDWPRLAGATVAGHLIECGTQVTGGIATDWLDVPDVAHIGFPIVEVAADGSCVVTKPKRTGGCVTAWTVQEQLVYEIGDPEHYLSPDVEVSFRGLTVEDLGEDRVRVRGAVGHPAPAHLKVSATYRDGYRAAGTLTIFGRDAVRKARRAAEVVLQRVRDAGGEWRDAIVETLGAGGCFGEVLPGSALEATETVLRIALESASRETVERFAKELMPLITSGPPGTTGYAEGRPPVHAVVRFWPCLIERQAVTPQVELFTTPAATSPAVPSVAASSWTTGTAVANTSGGTCTNTPASTTVSTRASNAASATAGPTSGGTVATTSVVAAAAVAADTRPDTVSCSRELLGVAPRHRAFPTGTLQDVARARSGDKGLHANIGVLARHPAAYPFLQDWLTAERVAEFLRPLGHEGVQRFELPNLGALNFVVRGILRRNLRTDAQGKALGQLLLELPLPAAKPLDTQPVE